MFSPDAMSLTARIPTVTAGRHMATHGWPPSFICQSLQWSNNYIKKTMCTKSSQNCHKDGNCVISLCYILLRPSDPFSSSIGDTVLRPHYQPTHLNLCNCTVKMTSWAFCWGNSCGGVTNRGQAHPFQIGGHKWFAGSQEGWLQVTISLKSTAKTRSTQLWSNAVPK